MADVAPLWPDIPVKAFISGCSSTVPTAGEMAFFAAEQPLGLILFARNCGEPAEVAALTAAFREAVGRPDAPVLIDQEGGRVQRLRPPHWDVYPPADAIGRLALDDPEAGERAAWLHGRLIADDLLPLGIDVDCAPVLDIATPATSEAIGDRSFGTAPERVAVLGERFADGLLEGGVLPVAKHIPGHGRATVDSHQELPHVDADLDELAATDFVPFIAMASVPVAMTAHVVFSAVDRINAATVSSAVVRGIIRDRIGFDGLLLSDDVSMHALSGDYAARGAAIYDAGCDVVLHCNGRAEEMRAIAEAAPVLSGVAAERAAAALARRRAPAPFDRTAGRAEYLDLVSRVGWAATG